MGDDHYRETGRQAGADIKGCLENPAMPINVTILGSGTGVPSLTRSACSLFADTGAEKILFDMGPGTMHRLLEAGVTIFDVTHIFISHFHPDHTAELVPFLFATKYPDGRRRRKPLCVFAGEGFKKFFMGLRNVYGKWIELESGMLRIFELSTHQKERIYLDAVTVETIPVVHNPESLGFRLTDANHASMVYTGDTAYTENLVTLANNADLLICECAVPDALETPGHLTPSLAGEIATRARVAKLVLTHLYPECDTTDIEKECRKTYKGPLFKAEDLMTFNLCR